MKKLWILLIVMLTAGCAGTGMRTSGDSGMSGSSGYSGQNCLGTNAITDPDCIYFP